MRNYERYNSYREIFESYIETGSAYETKKLFHNQRTGKPLTPAAIYYAIYSYVTENPKEAFPELKQLNDYEGYTEHDLMVDTIRNAKKAFGGPRYSTRFVRAMENLDPEGKYASYYKSFIEQNKP